MNGKMTILACITGFLLDCIFGDPVWMYPVSYTHLDVYKRQASTLEVEYSVVIPTVLVITDEESLRIC